MSQSTYAFEDLATVLSHSAMGQLKLQGVGTGSITFAMANDTSAHDLAADGSVMTSKIKAGNRTVAIAVQQTSDAHKWLTKLYNYLIEATSSEWAEILLMCTAANMQVIHETSNMSIPCNLAGHLSRSLIIIILGGGSNVGC